MKIPFEIKDEECVEESNMKRTFETKDNHPKLFGIQFENEKMISSKIRYTKRAKPIETFHDC